MVNEVSEIQRLAEMVEQVEAMRTRFQPMPDEAMDLLSVLGDLLENYVMDLPCSGMADFSAKLRMLAVTNSNDDGWNPNLPSLLERCRAEMHAVHAAHFSVG